MASSAHRTEDPTALADGIAPYVTETTPTGRTTTATRGGPQQFLRFPDGTEAQHSTQPGAGSPSASDGRCRTAKTTALPFGTQSGISRGAPQDGRRVAIAAPRPGRGHPIALLARPAAALGRAQRRGLQAPGRHRLCTAENLSRAAPPPAGRARRSAGTAPRPAPPAGCGQLPRR